MNRKFREHYKMCIEGFTRFPNSSKPHVKTTLIQCPRLSQRIVVTMPFLPSSDDVAIPRMFIKHRKAGSLK